MNAEEMPIIEIDMQAALGNSDEYEFDAEELGLPAKSELERIASLAYAGRLSKGEITVRFVTEEESQSLNGAYRRKDKPTNILSFPYEYPEGYPEDEQTLLGDLVICKQVVEKEASEQNIPLSQHYAHLLVHGCLHLIGYDHIEDNEAEEMEALERDIIMNRLGHPDPYPDEV